MSKELHYIDEIAPFDEEQWSRLINYYSRTDRPKIAQTLESTMEFRRSMRTIQQMAGTSEDEIAALQQSILALALGVEPEEDLSNVNHMSHETEEQVYRRQFFEEQ